MKVPVILIRSIERDAVPSNIRRKLENLNIPYIGLVLGLDRFMWTDIKIRCDGSVDKKTRFGIRREGFMAEMTFRTLSNFAGVYLVKDVSFADMIITATINVTTYIQWTVALDF